MQDILMILMMAVFFGICLYYMRRGSKSGSGKNSKKNTVQEKKREIRKEELPKESHKTKNVYHSAYDDLVIKCQKSTQRTG